MSFSNNRTEGRFDVGLELTPDQPVDTSSALAAHAEAQGFDAVLVSNHFDNRDPFLTLAAIGNETDRIMLGPGVVNPYETHPVRLATQSATLAESVSDRVICGIGAGDGATLSKLDLDRDRPVRRVAQAVETVRELTANATLHSHRDYRLDGISLGYSSGSAVPVYVGAQGPTMLRMASALADGVLINGSNPTDYRAAAEAIDAGRRQRDDQLGDLHIVGFACVSIAETDIAAREAANPPVAFVVAGAPDAVIERYEIDTERVATIRRCLSNGDHAAAYRTVTPQMIDAFSVTGTVESVTDQLRSLSAHVDAVVAGSPLGPDRHQAIELLGRVAAVLRDEAAIAE